MARQTPRGIRNHNPGNIERTTPRTPWQGRVPDHELTDSRFEQFEEPRWGIRALARTLITYQDRHNLRTIAEIVRRWAPSNENDTVAYIAGVAKRTGIDPNWPLDLQRYRELRPVVEAIIWHENGQQPYDDHTIDAGLRLAGVEPPTKPLQDSRTVQGAAVAGSATVAGAAAEVIQEASTGIAPLVPYLETLRVVFVVLALAGVAVAIWGRMRVHRSAGV